MRNVYSLVTVIIPTLNEEANLPKCLERLAGMTVIVVDSGSSDRTIAIAQDAAAEVIPFQWNGSFPKKRNWVLRNHTFSTPWVLFLDADEYVSEAFFDELEQVLPTTSHVGFWLTYSNYFLGRELKYGDPFRKLALFRVGSGEYERIDDRQWSHLDMEVHEHPVLNGTVGTISAPIEHNDFKGLHAYIKRHNDYATWEVKRYISIRESSSKWNGLTRRQQLKYRLINSWLLGPLYFVVSYILRLGFLDGRPGLVFAVLKMCYFLQIKAKLEEARKATP